MTFLIFFISQWALAKPLKMEQYNNISLIQVNPYLGYSNQNFYGNGDVPALKGMTYGADLEYFFGRKNGLGIAPYISYGLSNLKNSSSQTSAKETLDTKTLEGGIKFYSSSLVLSFSYAKYNGDYELDIAGRKTTNDFEGEFFGMGIGYHLFSFNKWDVYFATKAYYGELDPSLNQLTDRLDTFKVDAFIQLQISLPTDNLNEL